jgi:hypothetical protein
MDSGWAGEVPPKLSVTVTLNEKLPLAVGVPVMAPLEEISERPPGSDPDVTVQFEYGIAPPLAVRFWE